MIAPAITRRLKLDPEIRTTAGGEVGEVSVTDTMSSVPNTVAHVSTRSAKRGMEGFVPCKAAICAVSVGWNEMSFAKEQSATESYGCVETRTFHRGTLGCRRNEQVRGRVLSSMKNQ